MNVTVPLQPGPEPGLYRGAMLFIMAGEWALTVRISSNGRQLEIPFREQVWP